VVDEPTSVLVDSPGEPCRRVAVAGAELKDAPGAGESGEDVAELARSWAKDRELVFGGVGFHCDEFGMAGWDKVAKVSLKRGVIDWHG